MLMQQTTFRAMGSQVLAVLDTDTPAAGEALANVPTWFAEWEAILSRFRPDSELARLNQRSGQWVPVSSVLWDVLALALEAARWSDGLVLPTLLPVLEAAGYVASLEGQTWQQAQAQTVPSRPSAPPPIADWQTIRCDPVRRAVWLPPGMRLDLGGIAKGWATEQAAQRLQAFGPTLVDAGGDIAVSAARSDGTPWPVGVADPAEPDCLLALLGIAQGAVASSGRDYRRWQHHGRWQHHIIDPRTGQPAQTDVVSATVVGPTAAQAEVAAKVALILGSRAGLAWLDAHPTFAGLLIREDSTVVYNHRLHTYLWKGYIDAKTSLI
jgi:thiamine biosynthesis lipoprotein